MAEKIIKKEESLAPDKAATEILEKSNKELEALREEHKLLENNEREISELKTKINAFKEKNKPKPIKYCKFMFLNREDPGLDISFAYNGVKYHVEDEKTYDFPKEVVEHLLSLKVLKSKTELDGEGNKIRNKDELSPRFFCQVTETYEKEG